MNKTSDPEVERRIIFILMEAGLESVKAWLGKIKCEWFQSPVHQQALSYIKECSSQGIKPDYSVLANKTHNGLNEIDTKLGALTVNDTSFMTLADELRIIYMRKILVEGANDALVKAENNPVEAMGILRTTQNRMLGEAPTQLVDAKEVCFQACRKSLNSRSQANGMFVPSHIDFMDSMIKVMRKQIWVEAAYQGYGKTALSIQQANSQSLNGLVIAYCCVESPKDEIMARFAAHNSNMEVLDLLLPERLKKYTEKKIIETYALVANRDAPPEICGSDDLRRDMDNVKLFCRAVKEKHNGKLDFVYVDFLQKFNTPMWIKGSANERDRKGIEYNLGACKELAEDLDVPVKILAQLNRESRKAGKPHMQDLRGSGSFEDDAHIITFLHRTSDKDRGDGYSDYEYYIDKGRLFWEPPCKLCFNGKNQKFLKQFPLNGAPIQNGHKYSVDDLPSRKGYKDDDENGNN